jgi:hypothetical protein
MARVAAMTTLTTAPELAAQLDALRGAGLDLLILGGRNPDSEFLEELERLRDLVGFEERVGK